MSKAKGSVNRSRIVSYQSRVVSMLSFNPPSRHTHQGLMLESVLKLNTCEQNANVVN